LRGPTGIQWPRHEHDAEGAERLYIDGHFNTDPGFCETFGHDLATGAPRSDVEYRALDPKGRAFLYGVDYAEPPEVADDQYPLLLTTGRTLYQFHTRTKTGRSPQLDRAAPDPWMEIAAADAASSGIAEGDLIRVESQRGSIELFARVTTIRRGHVFVPFHYGTWISPNQRCETSQRASNELTLTVWDPVSKQPMFKVAAVRVTKLRNGDGTPSTAPTTTAAAPVDTTSTQPTSGGNPALAQSTLVSDARPEDDRT
jgi:anaerobic selenocysteine-containing dehydrogenase